MPAEVVPFSAGLATLWDGYAAESGEATFAHTTAWMQAVEETYGHRCHSLLALDTGGRVTGILPLFQVDGFAFGRSLVSVPFAPYGGPCAGDAAARDALIREAVNRAETLHARPLEMRTRTVGGLPGFSDSTGYSTFLMDLSGGTEQVWDGMSRKVRNRIRNAQRHGLTCTIDQDHAAVRDFHAIYLRNQGDLGTPAHAIGFFDRIRRLFPGQVFILRVLEGDAVVASLFTVGFRDTLTVVWGASLAESQSLSPNNLAYWEALRFTREKGYRFLDFGRSLGGSGNYRFKQHWNGTEVPLHYLRYPAAMTEAPPQKRYLTWARIWRRLPHAVTRTLGPRIRKYIV